MPSQVKENRGQAFITFIISIISRRNFIPSTYSERIGGINFD